MKPALSVDGCCRLLPRWLALAMGALAAFPGVPGHAQQSTDPVGAGELAETALDELSVLARLTTLKIDAVSKLSQSRLDAPAMVSVVERPHIEALGHRTVADVLRTVPGIYLTSDRTYAGVGVRGFNRPGDYNARMLMLVDGQRINDVIYDQALPGLEFPVLADWVKRLEFVSGPSSSVYGGNALLGVANVVTLNGADVNGSRLRLQAGTQGSSRAVGEYGVAWPDGRDLMVGVASTYSRGGEVRLPQGEVRGLDATGYAALLLKYRDGPWQVQVSGSRRDKEVATAPYGTVWNAPGTAFRDHALFARLSWQPAEHGDWQHTAHLSLAHYRFDGQYRYEDVPRNVDVAQAQWLSGEYRATWRGAINHTVMLGAEFRHTLRARQRNEDIEPPAVYLDDEHRQQAVGLFVQDEYRMAERWSLTTGLRLDSVSTLDVQASPRAALVYRPAEGQAFKLLVGRAFRAPNLYERYYADGGVSQRANPGLRPEYVSTVELGMERVLDEFTRMSASVYRHRLREQIEFNDAAMQFVNRSRTVMNGVELELEQERPSGWVWRSSLALQDATSGGMRLSNSPRWLFKASGIMPMTSGWTGGLELEAMGARLTRTAERVPARVLVHGQVRKTLPGQQALTVRVTNLGDVRYADPVSSSLAADRIEQQGRQLEVGWEVAF